MEGAASKLAQAGKADLIQGAMLLLAARACLRCFYANRDLPSAAISFGVIVGGVKNLSFAYRRYSAASDFDEFVGSPTTCQSVAAAAPQGKRR